MQASSDTVEDVTSEMQDRRMANVPLCPYIAWQWFTVKRIAPREPKRRIRFAINRWLMRWHGGEKVERLLAVHDAKPMVKNTMAVQNRTAAIKSKMALNIGGLLGWFDQYMVKLLKKG